MHPKTHTRIRHLAAVALLFASAHTMAQTASASATNKARCEQLAKELDAKVQARARSVVPSESPTAAVQRSVDIGGILNSSVATTIDQLLSMDFAGLLNTLVSKGLNEVGRRANEQFNQGINKTLSSNRIPTVSLPSVTFTEPYTGTVPGATAGASTGGATASGTTKPALSPGYFNPNRKPQ